MVSRPACLEDALRALFEENAQALAGGTDWMVRHGRSAADRPPVVYIGHLEELRQVSLRGDALRIGAACTLSQLLQSPLLPGFLKLPLAQMASPAIRTVATLGGNVCNASPAADALPMLYALDAVLTLRSLSGAEEVPVQEFILGPGRTALRPGQLLVEVTVPLQRDWRCAYHKVGMRRANSLSKLSFCALADASPGGLRDVRVAFGAVAPTVVRSREAEEEILSAGLPLGPEALGRAAARYDGLIRPITDARSSRDYRRAVCLRLLDRYLREEITR